LPPEGKYCCVNAGLVSKARVEEGLLLETELVVISQFPVRGELVSTTHREEMKATGGIRERPPPTTGTTPCAIWCLCERKVPNPLDEEVLQEHLVVSVAGDSGDGNAL